MAYKMAQAEKPVHEFGRKVLSLQNGNFKCNMVMPAPELLKLNSIAVQCCYIMLSISNLQI